MKFVRGLMLIVLALAVVAGCSKSQPGGGSSSGGNGAVGPDVRDAIPDGAVLTAFYHGDRAAMQKTALADIWNEPGVKEFFDPAWESIRGLIRQNMTPDRGGPDLLAMEPLLRCQVAVGVYLIAPPAPPPTGSDMPQHPQPEVVIAVQAGPEGSPLRDALLKGLKPLVGDSQPTTQNGVVLTPLMGGQLSYAFKGQTFIAATKGMIAKAFDEAAPKVTASATWKALAAQTDLGREVLGFTLNVPQLLEMIPPRESADVTKALAVLGLSQAKGVALTWAPRGKGMATTLYVNTPTDSGLLAAMTATPIDDALLAMCPKNAEAMVAVNLDMPKLHDGLMNAIAQLAPPDAVTEINQAIREAEKTIGVRIRDELLASFDVGTLVAFTEGGLLMPNITIVQKVKNPAKADKAIESLLDAVSLKLNQSINHEMGGGPEPSAGPGDAAALPMEAAAKPSIKAVTHNGVTIKYANMFIATPAYVIKDGYLIVTASPVEMKDFLDRAAVGPITANADFKAVRGQLSTKAPQAIYYGDYRTTMKKAYYLLPTLAAVCTAMKQVPVKFDVGKLPGSDTIGKHLFGAAGSWQMTPDGIKFECYSPTGTAAPMTSLGMAGLGTSMLIPAVFSARQQASSVTCMANLKNIFMGLMAGASANKDQMPESLDQLVKSGMVTPAVLRCPQSDGSRACDYFYFPRRTSEDGSGEAIVACDLSPHGGRPGGERNVLFLDGHVMRMSSGDFETLLANQRNLAFGEAFRKAGGR